MFWLFVYAMESVRRRVHKWKHMSAAWHAIAYMFRFMMGPEESLQLRLRHKNPRASNRRIFSGFFLAVPKKKKSTTENLFVDCFANKYLALYTRFRVGVDILCIHFNVSGREWVVKPHKQKSKSNNCCSFLTGARWSLRRFAFHDANLNDTTLFERWFDDCWHEWVERRNPSRDRMENRLVNLLSKQS